jgi:hypothetical protein
MKIRKFVVNNQQLMLQIPFEDIIEALKDNKILHNIFRGKTPQPSLKILGILWNYVKDKMYFDFTDLIEHGSLLYKLKMFLILHLLYDQLGVLISYTITGKLIMQLCCKLGLTLKSKLPDNILEAWPPWLAQVPELKGYSFTRALTPGTNPEKTQQQIHVFADASSMTYAAVAHMRTENYGNVTVRFIQSRLQIKPVKSTATIPRIELMAMELGLTMIKRLIKTFEILPHNSYIWRDSRACHNWVRIETKLL